MKISIKTTNLEMTPAIREYIEKKIPSLEKFFRPNSDTVLAAIEIGMTSGHHKSGNIFRAEINLSDTATGGQFYAEAKKEDLYAAIDEMKAKAERECSSLKNKKSDKEKRGASRIKKILRSRG
ncbi:MAG: ribosome-associated translation inhibitor RaiA [Candidatus Paceibacterota bacterium]|jgi:ribosomal subunit interface protein